MNKKKHKNKKSSQIPAALFAFSSLLFLVVAIAFFYLLHKGNLLPGPASASSGYISWRVFDGGVDDPGTNYSESALNTSNVSKLKVLWRASTPAAADDSVVEEAAVSTSSGLKNMVFVNTIKGNLIAYNALTGTKIWERDPSSANFNGQGTKSTPAIDPSGKYIYAYALDGYVHKYNIATGVEISGGGFPEQVTRLPNNIEKGSGSINIANGYLYMAISANDGDYGHYVGHVVAIKLSSGAKTVWNAECSNIKALLTTSGTDYCANTQAGIWARPGVQVDPVTGNVFVATGNGNYNASGGGNNWGDSVIELKPDLSSEVDSYTPATYSNLDSDDQDLGSTAPVILPKQSDSNTPYMLIQSGKDGIVRLLNRGNLSGKGGPRHTGGELQTINISDGVYEQPAVWQDSSGTTWVFITDNSGDLYAYKVVTSGGKSSLNQVYKKSVGVISSPFIANGVLYLDGPHILAYNAATGSQLFTSSSVGISLNQHWEAPTVVNGMIYTTDYSGNLYGLYVPGVTPTSAPTASGSTKTGATAGNSTHASTPSSQSSGTKSSTGSSGVSKKKSSTSKKTGSTASQSSTGQPATGTNSTQANPATTPELASLASRIKQPLFIASASGAIIAAGITIKLIMLKGAARAGVLPTSAFAPASLAGKIRFFLSKLLGRG